ncbi:MAG: hypothetical protein K2X87_32510 [Gemmataceae bacterium]|nr:hypothetical protein [Gemmataceae bacterium]
MHTRHRLRFVPAVEPLNARLAPAAGQLDPTFGDGGVQPLGSAPVYQPAVLPDGRVLALIPPSNDLPGRYALARIEADGDPDLTFGTGGVVPLPRFPFDTGSFIASPDGGALFFGPVFDTAQADYEFAVARLTPAGTSDPTFGIDGIAVVSFDTPAGATSDRPKAAVVQPDGRIVIVGGATRQSTLDGVSITTGGMAVARLTADGRPDPTFGTDGRTVVPFPVGRFDLAGAFGVALAPDGRIVLGGEAAVDGSIQTRYGRPGYPGPGGTGPVTSWFTNSAPAVVRLTADGQLDATFGTGGRVLTPLPAQQTDLGYQVQAVSALPDGRVLLAGAGEVPTAEQPYPIGRALRLTAAGALDPTYGSAGVATSDVAPPALGGVGIDPKNRVVFANATAVARLTAEGVPDRGFGTDGKVDLDPLFGVRRPDVVFYPYGSTIQPNGDILLSGLKSNGSLTDGTGVLARLVGSDPPVGFVPAATGTVTAGGAADGSVAVFNPSGGGMYAAAGAMTAYAGFTGNVRSAVADVTGDGVPDYVTGAGPGGRPAVTVFDGATGNTVADWLAFEGGFAGGVFVSAADLDRDGRAEVVVTPDQGGGPRVVVFSVVPGGGVTMRSSFFGIDDPSFRGGARTALGDIDADGTPDLAVAAGFLGGPRVALFDGKSVLAAPARLVSDFFAFPGADAATLRNGVFVALGDLNGDNRADLIFGGGPGGAPRVFALNGGAVAAGAAADAQANPVSNFFVANNSADRGGVRVGVADPDGDGRADVVAGSGAGSAARVRVYFAGTFPPAGEPAGFQDLTPFGGAVLADGVYVG